MTTTQTLTRAEIYWDTTDTLNEGWAYRVQFGTEGWRIESGSWEWPLAESPTETQMQEAVALLCSEYWVEVEPGAVAVDLRSDGGHGIWQPAVA